MQKKFITFLLILFSSDSFAKDFEQYFVRPSSHDPMLSVQKALADTNLVASEKIFYGPNGITKPVFVGVIDAGVVSPKNPDLINVIHPDSSVSNSKHKGSKFSNYHGQFVTGILAALANNGFGIRGALGRNTQVYYIEVMNINEVENAIHKLVDAGVSTINISMAVNRKCEYAYKRNEMSNGLCGYPVTYNEVARRAINWALVVKNVSVVIAAGNDFERIPYQGEVQDNGLIIVGGMTAKQSVSRQSNKGLGVSLFAPEYGIYGLDESGVKSGEDILGTSFSTPLVTGAAALTRAYLVSHDIYLTPLEIKQLILETAKPSEYLRDQAEAGAYLDYLALAERLEKLVVNFTGYFPQISALKK